MANFLILVALQLALALNTIPATEWSAVIIKINCTPYFRVVSFCIPVLYTILLRLQLIRHPLMATFLLHSC